MSQALVNILYVVASVLFIFGIKGLTHPRTAVRGNLLGATGMGLAILVTLLLRDDQGWVTHTWTSLIIGAIVGGAIGYYAAWKVQMTGMPQMVALFNGFGGIASVLVAGAYLLEMIGVAEFRLTNDTMIATAASGLIGAVTFTGSLVAFCKLQEVLIPDNVLIPGRQLINAGLAILVVVLAVFLVQNPSAAWLYWVIVIASFALGVLLVIPIGGADMPVVIALLNSYSGLAAAATGFVINNNVLIIAGSLVGASGIILTAIMCKAMNRSLTNVLFGVLGPAAGGPTADQVYAGKIKATTAEEVAMILDAASRVVIVPGYGMAVSQAQHAVRDLANLLEKKGATVEYAVHPVAGRMPGHMNVLLAEADVPYDKLLEMDTINPTMSQVDVAIVVGANDVVNPVARTDPTSPIAGMPIIDVDKAKTVVVVKRSLSPGFAKIPNPLFAADNTLMFFSDGKKAFIELAQAVKETM
ncbi:MAG: NAD(P)(+) transhydrogenase (Re/Si-specific) subunit beta [Planctomycetes bacterium]|nr:NAD(P)(+) transhydrogenase (Re/Si-specific) subunit beta [Planctomycetota bacterium]